MDFFHFILISHINGLLVDELFRLNSVIIVFLRSWSLTVINSWGHFNWWHFLFDNDIYFQLTSPLFQTIFIDGEMENDPELPAYTDQTDAQSNQQHSWQFGMLMLWLLCVQCYLIEFSSVLPFLWEKKRLNLHVDSWIVRKCVYWIGTLYIFIFPKNSLKININNINNQNSLVHLHSIWVCLKLPIGLFLFRLISIASWFLWFWLVAFGLIPMHISSFRCVRSRTIWFNPECGFIFWKLIAANRTIILKC